MRAKSKGLLKPWQVIAQGNSLTKGDGSTPWPTQIVPLLAPTITRVWNCGINGGDGGYTTNLAALSPVAQVSSTKSRSICVLWEAGNAIYFNSATTAQQAYDQVAAWTAIYRNLGHYVIVPNLIPRVDWSAPQRAIALQYNTLLAARWQYIADATVDLTGVFTDATDETKYAVDHVHLNATGYGLVAAMFAPEILKLATHGST